MRGHYRELRSLQAGRPQTEPMADGAKLRCHQRSEGVDGRCKTVEHASPGELGLRS